MTVFTQKNTLLVAFSLMAIVTIPGVAKLTGSTAHVVDREARVSLAHIPDCEEAGLCRDRRRMIFPSKSERALERLQARGCTIEHYLEEGVSLSCPRGTNVSGARVERVFQAQDIQSNTQISVSAAWGSGAIGSTVRVAILDTGVQADHIDLDGRVLVTKNFTTSQDADGQGHGTHVAGIVSGLGTVSIDGTTAEGVAPDATLLVGKVCNDDGWCLEGDILAGMEWAVAQNADVLNMSLGGGSYGNHCDDVALADKANWTAEQGVVVVAAAGNNGAGVGVPACGSKVIAVGAVDSNDTRTSWSSYGEALDVMAPGVRVLSTYSCMAAGSCPGDWHARMSGTSMAAPHVAGAAALLLSAYPSMTVEDITHVLTTTADDIGVAGKDLYNGYGRINVASAFSLAEELFGGCADEDGDGVTVCDGDCNDTNPLVYPGAVEFCNAIDDDCNELLDDQCMFDGFCGDKVCQETEFPVTCPQDCRGTKGDSQSTGKKETLCGDGICEGREHSGSCSRDCGSFRGGSGNSSGKESDTNNSTSVSPGNSAAGKAQAPSNPGGGRGKAK